MNSATAFKNPTGNWSYTGPFHAHVTNEPNLATLSQYPGIRVEGTIVRVGENTGYSGRIVQGIGAIQLYTGDKPFYFGYKFLIRLCRPNGQLIWQNHHLQDVMMQKITDEPHGNWPKFYYDGKQIIGETSRTGTKYQLQEGQGVSFNRHGMFRFTKAFKTLAHLDITLPRKGWNPSKTNCRIRIPTGKCLTVSRSNYCLEWMNTQMIQNPYYPFGYRPGHQPLTDYEAERFLELLQPGPDKEEWALQATTVLPPVEVRKQYNELRKVATNPQLLLDKVERIKATLKAQS